MSCGTLLRVLTAILLCIDVFSFKCLAGRPCPGGAVRISTPEGDKCVCKDGFVGDKCQIQALQSTTGSVNKENRCPWYKCPERSFGFIKFFQDFSKPCFRKGMITGVMIGVLGTVLISVLIYITVRLCIHSCGRKTKSKSYLCCEKERPKSAHQETPKVTDPNSPSPSVTIDIPDIEILREQASNIYTKPEDGVDGKENNSVKSTTVSILENEIAKAVREAGSVCIDEAGEV